MFPSMIFRAFAAVLLGLVVFALPARAEGIHTVFNRGLVSHGSSPKAVCVLSVHVLSDAVLRRIRFVSDTYQKTLPVQPLTLPRRHEGNGNGEPGGERDAAG